MKTNFTILLRITNFFTRGKSIVSIMLFILLGLSVQANNIQLSNVSLQSQNTSQHSYLVQFDLSWDNSWASASSANLHDAAWIIIKYRLANEFVWHHATLHWVDGTGSADGHIVPTGAAISSSQDNIGGAHGVFVYHSSAMTQGSVNYSGVQLRWDYGVDGVGDNDLVEISVYGIEMVYVTKGAYYLGTGKIGGNGFEFYTLDNSSNHAPYLVNSEGQISISNSAGSLFYNYLSTGGGPVYAGDESGPLPSSYPKGYNAFYCMKYEISQQQYVDFLNNIATPNNRYGASSSGSRYGISLNTINNEYETTSPYIACGFLSGDDILSYLHWAALRPMTELEYEKACRGGASAVLNEFAWGNSLKAFNTYSISNSDATDEAISANYRTTAGNAIYSLTYSTGPVRCGIFAANSANNNSSNYYGRMRSGATYYGIMEMSGNIAEFVVSVGDSDSRNFNGLEGNGNLDLSSKYTFGNWPDTKLVYRGGSFADNVAKMQITNRTGAYNGGLTDYTARVNNHGGRGVRLAP